MRPARLCPLVPGRDGHTGAAESSRSQVARFHPQLWVSVQSLAGSAPCPELGSRETPETITGSGQSLIPGQGLTWSVYEPRSPSCVAAPRSPRSFPDSQPYPVRVSCPCLAWEGRAPCTPYWKVAPRYHAGKGGGETQSRGTPPPPLYLVVHEAGGKGACMDFTQTWSLLSHRLQR